jgi:hypothetical protein
MSSCKVDDWKKNDDDEDSKEDKPRDPPRFASRILSLASHFAIHLSNRIQFLNPETHKFGKRLTLHRISKAPPFTTFPLLSEGPKEPSRTSPLIQPALDVSPSFSWTSSHSVRVKSPRPLPNYQLASTSRTSEFLRHTSKSLRSGRAGVKGRFVHANLQVY